MSTNTTTSTKISKPAAYLAIATSAATLLFLISLHILSPEFDPAWRMVSEYANGNYGWVLSLMFAAWGISSWALAYTLWWQVSTMGGKIGLIFLILAGIGETMASIFDIHHSLHDPAGYIGIGCLPIAAMLISTNLGRASAWSAARNTLLWTANLTWISVVLLIVSFIVMIATFIQAGGDMTTTEVPVTLPDGVIAFVGWTNRLLILVYVAWVANAAAQSLKLHDTKA